MKQPKLSDLIIDERGTHKLRAQIRTAKKIKITINVDQDSLNTLRKLAERSGTPYQKLLNRYLKMGQAKERYTESRLDHLEKEIHHLKRKLAA